ncbi:MAG: DUF3348 family protein, partial [Ramlibacter sp.]|nr:DUF3348 family protein [Ramlibacter sp.]
MSSTFGNSTLVRLLAQWTPGHLPAPGADLAEALGRWVT